jgi:hypothetical protein
VQTRRIAAFLVFPLVSTALFYLYVHGLYGTFSPFAIYEGVMSAEQFREWRQMVMDIPFRERLDAFLDYFLDQRDGLLLYAPVYVFALPGLVEMFRKARREFFSLVFIAVPFVLNYGFFTHRQVLFAPRRVLLPVSWVAAAPSSISSPITGNPSLLGVPARRLHRQPRRRPAPPPGFPLSADDP